MNTDEFSDRYKVYKYTYLCIYGEAIWETHYIRAQVFSIERRDF